MGLIYDYLISLLNAITPVLEGTLNVEASTEMQYARQGFMAAELSQFIVI